MVAAARPVRSATSLMARAFTRRSAYSEQRVQRQQYQACGAYGLRPPPDRRPTSQRQDLARVRDCDPVLLTGASGYVGAHLLPVLVARGREVRTLVRRPPSSALPDGVTLRRGDAV